MSHTEQFLDKLKDAMASGKLVLPTLPEVALRIRDQVEQDNCSAQDIAESLVQDGPLSAHFIRIANSPMYRGLEKQVDLQTIIGRLGLNLVKNLVVSLSIKQIFSATSDVLDTYFREAWAKSVEIAAVSRMLATSTPGLSNEQALFAGLIHNIGVLPILVMLEREDTVFMDKQHVDKIIDEAKCEIGKHVLVSWDFPQHLIDVVEHCENFNRQTSDDLDYVDLVQIALLQSGYIENMEKFNFSEVRAFSKLNLDPEINVINIEENHIIIEETRSSLLG